MQLVDKLGVGLTKLESYGFEKNVVNGKVMYSLELKVKKCIHNGLEELTNIELGICIRDSFIQCEVTYTGNKVYHTTTYNNQVREKTTLKNSTLKYNRSHSVDEVLHLLSREIRAHGIVL